MPDKKATIILTLENQDEGDPLLTKTKAKAKRATHLRVAKKYSVR